MLSGAGGSELALVSKLKTLHEDNQRFFVPDKFSANKFGVRHYAESVSYTVDGWWRETATIHYITTSYDS